MGFIVNPFWAAAAVITPATFNPFRWYDAGSYALVDNASIGVANPWVDQSTNLSNATTTAGREPVFKTAIFGALPAVRMVGARHLAFDSGFFTLADFTIFLIAKINGDSLWLSRNGINRQVRAFRFGVNVYSLTTSGGSEVISGGLSVAATDARSNVWRRTGGAVDFYENAALVAGAVNASTFDTDQIGVIDGAPLNLDIGELVIYDTFLSDTDVLSLYNSYFKPKFGLP